MSFDSSRFPFNSRNDFLGVVMQQGRVQVDADWNEWLAELNRRIQAGTWDTFGKAVVPATTPEGFHITWGVDSKGAVTPVIGPGRIYVDGLLAENHGLPAPLSGGWVPAPGVAAAPPPAGLVWDDAMAELTGSNPVPFDEQPYLPGVTFPAAGGPFLVYVDVWQREVTYLEYPDLVEKAVGVDTTGRLQTVWQVKALDVSKDGAVTCATPDGNIPEYSALLKPPGAQLTTGVVQTTAAGVCCLAPNTGYTGLENQLYRVEIHKGGGVGQATFKWSRDNVSVETGVTGIQPGGKTLVVQSLGRDSVLRFSANDWIEITDDVLELAGLPGEIHQIKLTDPSSTITLTAPVNAASFPVDANGNTDPKRHTRIRRWDQKGQILESDGVTIWADLDALGQGDIPVPPAGAVLRLENGITVAFGLDPAGSSFAPGQFWNFAARTTDGTVEFLDAAPPRGIHHHYARLAVVTLPGGVTDCRSPWPPQAGQCCCCTVNIKPSDLTGQVTLQSVLDKFQNQNAPVTICLAAGTYTLDAPLQLTAAHTHIRIEGCDRALVVLAADAQSTAFFNDGLLVLDGANDIELRGLSFQIPYGVLQGKNFAGLPIASLDPGVSASIGEMRVGIGVRMVNVDQVTIEDCAFEWIQVAKVPLAFGGGIFATGSVTNLTVERNTFKGGAEFLAGYLHAPWANFNPPKGQINLEQLIPEKAAAKVVQAMPPKPGTVAAILQGLREQQAQVTKMAGSAEEAAKVGVVQLPDLAGALAPVNVGQLSASQAAHGGKTIPAVLDGAVFRDNQFTGLSIGIFVFGTFGAVEVSRNSVTLCRAGVWLLSPLDPQGVTLLAEPLVFFALSMATGYPLPKADATARETIAAAPATVSVFTGAANYTDSTNNVWTPDSQTQNVAVTASQLNEPQQPPAITNAQPAANDQPLYQNERWGPNFTYTFSNLTQGFYTVLLKFAEIFDADAGQRLINATINGQQVLQNLDLIQIVGKDVALDFPFVNIAPENGTITLELSGGAGAKDPNAKISAVQVAAQWNPGSNLTNIVGSGQGQQIADLELFYLEIGLLAQQGFSTLSPPAADLLIEENEMKTIGTFGVLVLGDDLVQKPATGSLVLNGNRIEVDGSTFLRQARLTAVEGTLAARLAAVSLARAGGNSIAAPAVILLVTRCVVNGNLLVNEDSSFGLLLYDSPAPAPNATVPVPEICISGNVLQGALLVVPERILYMPAGVPFPMNLWWFMNTVA